MFFYKRLFLFQILFACSLAAMQEPLLSSSIQPFSGFQRHKKCFCVILSALIATAGLGTGVFLLIRDSPDLCNAPWNRINNTCSEDRNPNIWAINRCLNDFINPNNTTINCVPVCEIDGNSIIPTDYDASYDYHYEAAEKQIYMTCEKSLWRRIKDKFYSANNSALTFEEDKYIGVITAKQNWPKGIDPDDYEKALKDAPKSKTCWENYFLDAPSCLKLEVEEESNIGPMTPGGI